MGSRSAIAIVTLALLVAFPAEARADPATAARFHDARARRFYERGLYEDALREFFAEQRLAPNPRISFNIALCFLRLDRPADGFVFFREYLDSKDGDAGRRAIATSALESVLPKIARARIESDPPGAKIFVDVLEHGQYGTTPAVLPVAPGKRRIVLELEGYETAELEIEARLGEEVAVARPLARILGELAIASSVPGQVRVRAADGAIVAEGDTPLTTKLAPGTYELDVVADDHRPHRSLARVEAGAVTQKRAELERLPPPTGDVTITSNVQGAVVSIDGRPSGFTPSVLLGLTTGEHTIAVEREGTRTWSDRIVVEPEQRVWVNVTLEETGRETHTPWMWALGGIGGAALIGGAVVGALAVVAQDEVETQSEDPNAGRLADDIDRGNSLNVTADVLFVGAALALASSAALYLFTGEPEDQPSTASIARTGR